MYEYLAELGEVPWSQFPKCQKFRRTSCFARASCSFLWCFPQPFDKSHNSLQICKHLWTTWANRSHYL